MLFIGNNIDIFFASSVNKYESFKTKNLKLSKIVPIILLFAVTYGYFNVSGASIFHAFLVLWLFNLGFLVLLADRSEYFRDSDSIFDLSSKILLFCLAAILGIFAVYPAINLLLDISEKEDELKNQNNLEIPEIGGATGKILVQLMKKRKKYI